MVDSSFGLFASISSFDMCNTHSFLGSTFMYLSVDLTCEDVSDNKLHFGMLHCDVMWFIVLPMTVLLSFIVSWARNLTENLLYFSRTFAKFKYLAKREVFKCTESDKPSRRYLWVFLSRLKTFLRVTFQVLYRRSTSGERGSHKEEPYKLPAKLLISFIIKFMNFHLRAGVWGLILACFAKMFGMHVIYFAIYFPYLRGQWE